MQSELNIVKYRKLFEQPDVLECSCDALFVDLNCAVPGQFLAIQEKVSFRWFVDTRQQVEGRRFACTVRSDQTIELSLVDGHGELIDRFQASKRDP